MESKEYKLAHALGYLSASFLTATAIGAGWTLGHRSMSKLFDRKKRKKKIVKES